MYQTPDSGCKIKDTCCGRSMVMLELKLVKGKAGDDDFYAVNGTAPEDGYKYRITLLK